MKQGHKAFGISLALHGLSIAAFLMISDALPHQRGPVFIDLALLESGVTAPARQTGPAKQESRGRRKKVVSRKPPAERKMEAAREPKREAVARPVAASPQPASQPLEQDVPAAGEPPDAAGTGSGNPAAASAATAIAALSHTSGSGASSEQRRENYKKENYSYIKTLIENNIRYPARARRMRWTGRVVVVFEVKNDGHVENIRVKESSGHEVLDRNVIDTIRAVQPFPRPPEWVMVSIPIRYRLQ